jgi:hypothetical protein
MDFPGIERCKWHWATSRTQRIEYFNPSADSAEAGKTFNKTSVACANAKHSSKLTLLPKVDRLA